MANRTPLYDEHVSLGARIVDFAGWDMPVQYTGIVDEHNACRNSAALFDICHMGEIEIKGTGLRSKLNRVLSNDFAKLADGKAGYGFFLNDKGGIIDDEITMLFSDERAIVVTNAANTAADLKALTDVLGDDEDVCITDISDSTAKLDLQGPKSLVILRKLLGDGEFELKRFSFTEVDYNTGEGETKMIVSRTGYTGELGFELYLDTKFAAPLWRKLLELGAPEGIVPGGLGARDTLRLEAGLPLHGHELSSETTPIEAALSRFVALDKAEDFPGKGVLKEAAPITRKLVALKCTERGVPRDGCEVYADEKLVGSVTSGTMSPTLGTGIAFAYVDKNFATLETKLNIRVRKRSIACVVTKRQFYTPAK